MCWDADRGPWTISAECKRQETTSLWWLPELDCQLYKHTCLDASAGAVAGLLPLSCLTAVSRYSSAGTPHVLWLQSNLGAWLSGRVQALLSSVSWIPGKEKQCLLSVIGLKYFTWSGLVWVIIYEVWKLLWIILTASCWASLCSVFFLTPSFACVCMLCIVDQLCAPYLMTDTQASCSVMSLVFRCAP